ncbi:MAG: methanogenesis marker 2 protein [Methanomassiliicoccales archaeon]|nr:methanogenesis marker 2 protein [Methanomassiliicoccales archaeon]
MNLEALISDIRKHPGITRKRTISDVLHFFPKIDQKNILASWGEDAAVIEFGDSVLLLAADGIMEPLMKTNPYFAGYYSVLVNIHDILAMGGVPLAMVDVISMKEEKICAQVMRGVEAAVRKFGVPMVGGHTHPDCEYHAIDVAILGVAGKNEVIYSHTAESGDDIIFAMDTDGYFPEKLPYAWDTTSRKSEEFVRRQMRIMNEIGKRGLVNSGKDMSNPGSLGTLGMLLETSGKGGIVDIDLIPRPENEDLTQWLKAYQGFGFVLTANPKNSEEIINLFKSVRVDAAVVGNVQPGSKLILKQGNNTGVLFDFDKDVIAGCKGPFVTERVRKKSENVC